jgi:helicase
MKLSDLGYPPEFIESVGGNFDLYPHQQEALSKLKDHRNLIVTVPTAAGKTLIAYAAIFDMIRTGKKCLYIVPLKALAFEKYEEMKALRKLGVRLTIATGDYDASASFIRNYDIVVCTSEKADSMIRHDPSMLFDVGLIVADEAHLIGDPSRGPRLEMVLTTARVANPDTMILALSATISNPEDICEWLDSNIVASDFRPVKLKRGVLYGNMTIFEDESSKESSGDVVLETIASTLNDGGQCLLFVSSRKKAEELASKIALFLQDRLEGKGPSLSLEDDPYGDKINGCLAGRTCFHHAGLSNPVRSGIESFFKNRDLLVLVATPTLAAGVNLPARCVIIRDITRYQNGRSEYLPAREIFQMLGRAGRPKYDTEGYAYLYAASSNSFRKAMDYFSMEIEPTMSGSGSPDQIRFNTLALVAMGMGNSADEIGNFYRNTLFAFQNPISNAESIISASIRFLSENGLISDRGGRLIATEFGKATADLYLNPESAIILMDYLKGKHSEELALFNLARCPDMITINANNDDYAMAEYFLDKVGTTDYDDSDYSAAKTAMLLKEWISETPMRSICEQFRVGPGDVQSVANSADWLSYSLARLANSFKPEIRKELDNLNFRIKEGVREEIIPLTLMPGIGRVRARRLYSAGLTSLEMISTAEEAAISKIYGFSSKLSRDVIASAKSILAKTGSGSI